MRRCEHCNRPIRWARTPTGPTPLDYRPDPRWGSIMLRGGDAIPLTTDQRDTLAPAARAKLYSSHLATCPGVVSGPLMPGGDAR